MIRNIRKVIPLLVAACFLSSPSCRRDSQNADSGSSPDLDHEIRLRAIESSLLVVASNEDELDSFSAGIAISPKSPDLGGNVKSRNRDGFGLFPRFLDSSKFDEYGMLAGTNLDFAERIKISEIENSPSTNFSLVNCRLPYQFPFETVLIDEKTPTPETRIIFLTVVHASGFAPNVEEKRVDGSSFTIKRTTGTVISSKEAEAIDLEIRFDVELPVASSHVAVSENGKFLGMALPSSNGKFRLETSAELKQLADPQIRSVDFTLEEERGGDDLYSVRFEVDLWQGFGWEELNAVVVPTESIVPDTSENGDSPIFIPDTVAVMRESGRLEAKMDIAFQEAVEVMPGEMTSLSGQLFAESGDEKKIYFPPFHWGIKRSPSGRSFECSFEPHPFAKIAERQRIEEELEEAAEFSEARRLRFEGEIQSVFPLGNSENILLQTNQEPFLLDLHLNEETINEFRIPGQRSDFSDVYLAAGSGHIFVLDAVDSILEKWSYTTGDLVSKVELAKGEEYFAIAVASSRDTAPVMVVSDQTIHFFSQADLSPVVRKHGPENARENYLRETFEFLHGPPEKGGVYAEASGDGLSYFAKITHPSGNRGLAETVLFRPFQDLECFRHIRQCDLLDLGIDGDILFEGSLLTRYQLDRIPYENQGKFLCCNLGASGYFTIERSSVRRGPVIPKSRPVVRLYIPGVEEPIFATDRFEELGLIEASGAFPALTFFPDSNRLFIFPSTGGEILIRTLESSSDLNIPVKVTSVGGLEVTRGETMTHQFTFLSPPLESTMIKGPQSAKFNPERNQLSFSPGLDFASDHAICEFQFENEAGTATSHKVSISILGQTPSLLSSKNPWIRKPGVAKPASKGVVPHGFPMEERIADLFPVGGGEFFAIYTSADTKLQLFDPGVLEFRTIAFLPGDYVLMTGNSNAVFCYYPSHGVVERRGVPDLTVEKTAFLESGCILSRFDTSHLADDSIPIVCIEDGVGDHGRDRLRFMDPKSLEFADQELEESFLRASRYSIPDCRGITNHLPLSEDGSMIIVGDGIVQFDRDSVRRVPSAHFDIGHAVSISRNAQSLLFSSVQQNFKTGAMIDRSPSDLDCFKFDLEGEHVIGFDIEKKFLHPRTAQIIFFKNGQQMPSNYLRGLMEFDEVKQKLGPLRDNSFMGEYERLFYSSTHGFLLTVPWDNQSVVVRHFGLDESNEVSE